MKTYGATILDVTDAITNANLNYPAGTIKESFYEYLIRTLGEFEDIKEIGEVVVKSKSRDDQRTLPFEQELARREISKKANLVMVNDVARVKDTFKERSSYSRHVLSGKPWNPNNHRRNRLLKNFATIPLILPSPLTLKGTGTPKGTGTLKGTGKGENCEFTHFP